MKIIGIDPGLSGAIAVLKNNKVTGFEVNGKSYNSDLVISNVDIHFVYKNLLDVKKKPIRIFAGNLHHN